MARPRKCRRVCALPGITEFHPHGSHEAMEFVTLTVDEYEAIRLIDYQGFSQEKCGEQMNVARTTVQQIYGCARRKLAEALVEGCGILIEGGDYRICQGREGGCRHAECIRQPRMKTIKNGGNEMRIAVTYENGQIFQHFGHTAAFKIYDVADGKVNMSVVVNTDGSGHGALAGMLARLHVDTLICGGIGGGAQTALKEAGIRLFGGVSGDADAAVEALLKNELDYDPDAKCDHHEHHHHGEHTCGDHGCGSHSCH